MNVISQYLGDGVYVDFYPDGSFILYINKGPHGIHEIYFESGMLQVLNKLMFEAMQGYSQSAETKKEE